MSASQPDKKEPVAVKVTAVEWTCPCGLGMAIPETPVCVCGEYRLEGRTAVPVKAEVAVSRASDKAGVAGTAGTA